MATADDLAKVVVALGWAEGRPIPEHLEHLLDKEHPILAVFAEHRAKITWLDEGEWIERGWVPNKGASKEAT